MNTIMIFYLITLWVSEDDGRPRHQEVSSLEPSYLRTRLRLSTDLCPAQTPAT
jgi:hypothetical protein